MPKVAKPRRHGRGWRISYQDMDGKRALKTFATHQEAKDALNARNAEAKAVRTGAAPRPPDPRTFDELADYWLEHRTAQKRSPKDDQSIIGRHLRPSFGRFMLTELTLERVDRFVVTRRSLSAKTQVNVLNLLSAMLKLAVELGWLVAAPKIRKPKLVEQDYHWLRTEEDVRRLLDAATEEAAGVMELYATAVYTGLRAGELLGLRWEDIDFGRRLITVRGSYDKPTKTGAIRHVPILDPLLPVLRAWRLACPTDVVFPGATLEAQGPSARVLQEVFQRCMLRAGLTEVRKDVPLGAGPAAQRGGTYAGLTFHDLRHTFASHWVMKGGDIFRLQRILGHATTQMTLRYAHLAPEAFASDWGRLGNMVPTEGEVVELRQR